MRPGLGPRRNFQSQRLKAELLVYIADLQPVGLVEAGLQEFNSLEPQAGRPSLKSREHIHVGYFGFRSLQEHMKQVPQKGIADVECGFEIVPAFGERLGRIKKWPPVRSAGGSGNTARYGLQEFQPRLATPFVGCKI